MIDPIYVASMALAALQIGFIYLAVMYILYVAAYAIWMDGEPRLTTAAIPKFLIYYPFIGYMYLSAACTIAVVGYLASTIVGAS